MKVSCSTDFLVHSSLLSRRLIYIICKQVHAPPLHHIGEASSITLDEYSGRLKAVDDDGDEVHVLPIYFVHVVLYMCYYCVDDQYSVMVVRLSGGVNVIPISIHFSSKIIHWCSTGIGTHDLRIQSKGS